jgi:hypothetical protein
MAIGWRLKLLDTRSGYVLWAGDELFDAGRPAVVAAVRQYVKTQATGGVDEEWAFLNSPRRFGQYSMAELLETLPVR